MTGHIKSIHAKGFGFIRGQDHVEYFFHASEFTGDWRELTPEMPVTFEVSESRKGPRATNVRRVGELR
ncbi:MAG TPA: cold shock domain-containing protein [Pseudonocardiaceae bacterium]|nr:cold shock domain-containing protein [Pseudonocardiaceae bacterium]